MASNTQVTRTRRKMKLRKIGKERKRLLRSRGTTPRFPIHPEEEKSQ